MKPKNKKAKKVLISLTGVTLALLLLVSSNLGLFAQANEVTADPTAVTETEPTTDEEKGKETLVAGEGQTSAVEELVASKVVGEEETQTGSDETASVPDATSTSSAVASSVPSQSEVSSGIVSSGETSSVSTASSELEADSLPETGIDIESRALAATGTFGTVPYTFDSATGILTFGGGAFPSVTSYDTQIPWYNNAEVKKIVFTETVEFSADWLDTSAYSGAAYMFAGLTKLETIEGMQYVDTSKVKDVTHMFWGDTSLKNLQGIETWTLDSVLRIRSMFYGCESLEYINLKSFTGRKLVPGNQMSTNNNLALFVAGTKSLKYLNLENFDPEYQHIDPGSGNYSNFGPFLFVGAGSVEKDYLQYTPTSPFAINMPLFNIKALGPSQSLTAGNFGGAPLAAVTIAEANGLAYIEPFNGLWDSPNFFTSSTWYYAEDPSITFANVAEFIKQYSYKAGTYYRIPANFSVIIYDENYEGGSSRTQGYGVGTAITLLDKDDVEERPGYSFKGWNTAADGSGTSYAAGASYTTVAGVTTLYAQWSDGAEVLFDANAGAATVTDMPDTIKGKNGETITLTSVKEPKRDGYKFDGWYTDTTYTTKMPNSITIGTTDVTYYAKWTANKITITLDKNNASAVLAQTTITAAADSAVDMSTWPVPTLDGYDFAGWYDAATNGNPVNITKMPLTNVTYYAHWGAQAPKILTESLPNGGLSLAYKNNDATKTTVTLEASGGGTKTWSLVAGSGSLPDGLTLNADGTITGTPTKKGDFTFTVEVSNGTAPNDTKEFTIKIKAGAPEITKDALAKGTINVQYSDTLTAEGTPDTFVWSITNGTLPAGLTLDKNTGVISGIPTKAGKSTITVSVSNTTAPDATKTYDIVIEQSPAITTKTIADFTLNTQKEVQLEATGYPDDFAWSLESGTLPAGVTLGTDGKFGGTPTETGSFTFTAKATTALGSATQSYTFRVVAAPTITTEQADIPDATLNKLYTDNNVQLEAEGYPEDFAWALDSGSKLPTGLTLTADGEIVGTPTKIETVTFTVKVTNELGSATKQFTIAVNQGPTVTTSSLPSGVIGLAYKDLAGDTVELKASGTPADYSWSLVAGGGDFPDGLTLNTDGTITGTPTKTGLFTFTVEVDNGVVPNGTRQLTIQINQPAEIDETVTLADGIVGDNTYNQTLLPKAGVPATFTWTIVDPENFPNGLSLDASTGVISGTPTKSGTFTFTVQLTNQIGTPDTESFTIYVKQAPIIDNMTLADGIVGDNTYSQQLTAKGEPNNNFEWSLAGDSALPDGLTLSISGLISGEPTTAGKYTFTVEVSNGVGEPATKEFEIYVKQAPIIGDKTLADGIVGDNTYSQQLTATGEPNNNFAWSLVAGSGNLPDGLILGVDGKITGTPSKAGTFNFVVEVDNGVGKNTHSFSIYVKQEPKIDITNKPNDGSKDQAYTPFQFTASQGEPSDNFTWTVAEGSLPDGLTLNADGTITGIPTKVQTSTFKVTLSNGVGQDDTQEFTISIYEGPTITTTNIPYGRKGYQYDDFQVVAVGSPNTFTWSLATGSKLPDGLNLTTDGKIVGTPTKEGEFTFTLVADNTVPPAAQKTFNMNVYIPPTIKDKTLKDGALTVVYTETLEPDQGDPSDKFVWSLTGEGTFPDGLTLNADGTIAGTPTKTGTFTFKVNLTNTIAPDAQKEFTIVVNAGPVIDTESVVSGIVGVNYNQELKATATPNNVEWSINGSLPNGLSIDKDTGIISGTPTAKGTTVFTAVAKNGILPDGTKDYALIVFKTPNGKFDLEKGVAIEASNFAVSKAEVDSLNDVDYLSKAGVDAWSWTSTGENTDITSQVTIDKTKVVAEKGHYDVIFTVDGVSVTVDMEVTDADHIVVNSEEGISVNDIAILASDVAGMTDAKYIELANALAWTYDAQGVQSAVTSSGITIVDSSLVQPTAGVYTLEYVTPSGKTSVKAQVVVSGRENPAVDGKKHEAISANNFSLPLADVATLVNPTGYVGVARGDVEAFEWSDDLITANPIPQTSITVDDSKVVKTDEGTYVVYYATPKGTQTQGLVALYDGVKPPVINPVNGETIQANDIVISVEDSKNFTVTDYIRESKARAWTNDGTNTSVEVKYADISEIQKGVENTYIVKYSTQKGTAIERLVTVSDGNVNVNYPEAIAADNFSMTIAKSNTAVDADFLAGSNARAWRVDNPNGDGSKVTIPVTIVDLTSFVRGYEGTFKVGYQTNTATGAKVFAWVAVTDADRPNIDPLVPVDPSNPEGEKERSGETIVTNDIIVYSSEVAGLSKDDYISRANARAWNNADNSAVEVTGADFSKVLPDKNTYPVTYSTDKGSTVIGYVNVIPDGYKPVPNPQENEVIVGEDFTITPKEFSDGISDVSYITKGDVSAWTFDATGKNTDIPANSIAVDASAVNGAFGTYPITYTTPKGTQLTLYVTVTTGIVDPINKEAIQANDFPVKSYLALSLTKDDYIYEAKAKAWSIDSASLNANVEIIDVDFSRVSDVPGEYDVYYKTANGTTTKAVVTVIANDITLVRFDGNGATVQANPTSISIEEPAQTLSSLPAQAPTRIGHTFLGWNEKQDGTGNAIDLNTVFTEDTTVYAQWSINSYVLSFDTQGTGTPPASQTLVYDTLATQPSEELSKKGHTFIGWYTSPTGGSYWNFAESKMPANDQTLYAQFSANKYNVTFVNKENNTNNVVAVTYDTTVPQPVKPFLYGYTFLGWFDSNGTAWNFATLMPDYDIVLTAKWERTPYTVTYMNYNETEVIAKYTLFAGEQVPGANAPNVGGHHFAYWGISGTDLKWSTYNAMPAENLVLIARYDKNLPEEPVSKPGTPISSAAGGKTNSKAGSKTTSTEGNNTTSTSVGNATSSMSGENATSTTSVVSSSVASTGAVSSNVATNSVPTVTSNTTIETNSTATGITNNSGDGTWSLLSLILTVVSVVLGVVLLVLGIKAGNSKVFGIIGAIIGIISIILFFIFNKLGGTMVMFDLSALYIGVVVILQAVAMFLTKGEKEDATGSVE